MVWLPIIWNSSEYLQYCWVWCKTTTCLSLSKFKGTWSWLGNVCLQFLFISSFIHEQYKVILKKGQPFSNILHKKKSYVQHMKNMKLKTTERQIFVKKIASYLSFPTKLHYPLFMSRANVYQQRLLWVISALLSPRNSVGGDIVKRPFVGGWVSEWVGSWVGWCRE